MIATQRHDITISSLTKPVAKVSVTQYASPKTIIQAWIDQFAAVLSSGDVSKLQTLFHAESWWRDHLALEWDFHTIRGLPSILAFLEPRLPSVMLSSFKIASSGQFAPKAVTPIEGLEWVETMFTFETKVGRGKGMLRLAESEDGTYKCHMFYTALQELKGFEELSGDRRAHGGHNSLLGGISEGNWFERRQKTMEFTEEDPDILIIGAGQAGLNIGAHLQALRLKCLLIDKNARVGDNWRHRYRTLVTHDPVQYTHMAYLPFPSSWPLFTPKDKLGDWFEAYASLMELNVWLSTTIDQVEYLDAEKSWTVKLNRWTANSAEKRTLHAKHIVFCTGHAGEPRTPTFPGQSSFKGIIYHGSQHRDASTDPNVKGKRVVVVGTGNSGHDIAQNFWENGAGQVTMLQRSGTYVLKAGTGLLMLHKGLYDETGPPIEDADVFAQSLPIPVQFALNVDLTTRIAAAEKANIDGLAAAGFKLDFGHDGSGIYRKYITRGGGYYIDVGASQMIIDGKIKVVQSADGIQRLEEHALVLADGRKIETDVVVLATGYDNMRTTLRKVLGDKVADRAKDVWDLDEEGEVNAMWRPSGHPRLWFMGGSLALCRTYSRFLALQIKAIEEGLLEG